MILRPDNLVSIKVDFEFNFQMISCLEIDLTHVNKDKRSSFSGEEVALIVELLISNSVLRSSDEKEFRDEFCSYFVKKGEGDSVKYKIVFCICSDRPTTIGVITLHRIKK